MSVLVHLIAPPFHDHAQIADCIPLADGILVVVDCSAGLTENFRNNFRQAAQQGLQPVVFLNKLDKLLSLESDDEACYQRIVQLLDEMNDLLEGTQAMQLQVTSGNVVFGRGSLSVAESIGGWGFTVREIINVYAARKGWSEAQVKSFSVRAWGDHFVNTHRSDSGRERGFCALVLRPLRELFAALENGYAEGSAKLEQLGVVPPEGLTGNSWKQGAAEAWLPLADVLLREVSLHVPPPASAVGCNFYAAKSISSADGRSVFAFGRRVAAPFVGLPMLKGNAGQCSLLNGPTVIEVPFVNVESGGLLGVPLSSACVHAGPFLVQL